MQGFKVEKEGIAVVKLGEWTMEVAMVVAALKSIVNVKRERDRQTDRQTERERERERD